MRRITMLIDHDPVRMAQLSRPPDVSDLFRIGDGIG